ncbi:MAG: DUF4870 domain-containing protein [Verrucomicrobiales bacterium]|nr:DUF4870 domain-containing protein [Verrucomicrobiales bacterium]
MLEKDVRMWCMLCHLSALAGLLLPYLGTVIGPLVVWLLKRNEHPDIDAHGKDSLNFQISALIYAFVLAAIGGMTLFILIGILFLFGAFVVGLGAVIYAVIGAVRASNGQPHKYPFTIRFLT